MQAPLRIAQIKKQTMFRSLPSSSRGRPDEGLNENCSASKLNPDVSRCVPVQTSGSQVPTRARDFLEESEGEGGCEGGAAGECECRPRVARTQANAVSETKVPSARPAPPTPSSCLQPCCISSRTPGPSPARSLVVPAAAGQGQMRPEFGKSS